MHKIYFIHGDFFDGIKLLNRPGENTNWNRIMELYDRMKEIIALI